MRLRVLLCHLYGGALVGACLVGADAWDSRSADIFGAQMTGTLLGGILGIVCGIVAAVLAPGFHPAVASGSRPVSRSVAVIGAPTRAAMLAPAEIVLALLLWFLWFQNPRADLAGLAAMLMTGAIGWSAVPWCFDPGRPGARRTLLRGLIPPAATLALTYVFHLTPFAEALR